jgi:transcriptional regulator with XRE-family HTH domain
MVNRQRVTRQLGSALRRIRLDRGARQRAVAQLAEIDPRLLSSIERGGRAPSPPVLVALLVALDCSVDEFGRYFGPWGNVEDLPLLAPAAKHQRRRGGP